MDDKPTASEALEYQPLRLLEEKYHLADDVTDLHYPIHLVRRLLGEERMASIDDLYNQAYKNFEELERFVGPYYGEGGECKGPREAGQFRSLYPVERRGTLDDYLKRVFDALDVTKDALRTAFMDRLALAIPTPGATDIQPSDHDGLDALLEADHQTLSEAVKAIGGLDDPEAGPSSPWVAWRRAEEAYRRLRGPSNTAPNHDRPGTGGRGDHDRRTDAPSHDPVEFRTRLTEVIAAFAQARDVLVDKLDGMLKQIRSYNPGWAEYERPDAWFIAEPEPAGC